MATPSIPAGFKLVPDDGGSVRPPEARGKAAALSAYLARGGTPFKMSGRYKKGPMKGKTVDEATAAFERMWASAPDSIKEKYASRAQKTDLAPSERNPLPDYVTQNASRSKPPVAPPVAPRSAPAPTPAPVVPPAAAPSAFAELTKPVAPPAGGVNSVGDGQFTAGKAAPVNFVDTRPVDTANKLTGKTRAEQAAVLMEDAKANPPTAAQKVTQSAAPPSPNLPPSAPAPAPAKRPGMTMTEAFSANDANPFMNVDPAVDAVRDQAKNQAQAKIDAKAAADAQARNQMNAERANTEAARLGVAPPPVAQPAPAQPVAATQPAPTAPPIPSPAAAPMTGTINDLPTDERMKAQGKVNGGPTQVVKAPAKPPTTNSQTGLPMGYRPGDSTVGLDAAKVAESNQRVAAAQASAPPIAPPRATIAPAPVRYADAQSQYQAGKAPAAAMDKVYAGASGIDQAKITAQSLKRAGALNRTQTQPPARRPVLAR